MRTAEIRNQIMFTKTVRNDLYLTAIMNTQEKEIQRLHAVNIELKTKLSNYKVNYLINILVLNYLFFKLNQF